MRVLRVAELIQSEQSVVNRELARLPSSISATATQVASGVLLTLEIRRSWWDRRPREWVLSLLGQALADVVDAASRVLIVGAVIEQDGWILAAQRAHPPAIAGKWEFPGGKVELGETPATAIVRECAEELAVAVTAGAEIGRLSLDTGAVLVMMTVKLVDPTDEPNKIEHLQLRWCRPNELMSLDWLPTNAGFAQQLAAHS